MAGLLLQSAAWIRTVALARIRGSRDLAQLDLSQRQPIWRIVNAFAQEARKNVVDFVSYSINIIPIESVGVWLRRHSAAYGLPPLTKTKQVGVTTLQADTGETPAFAAGLELTASDGVRYQTTDAVLAGDWSGGSCTVASESITLGTTANKETGTPLVVVAPPAGLLSSATLGATTTEATDDETDPQLQLRLKNRLAGMPAGGNCAEYRQWALEAIALNYGGHSNEAVDAAVYPRWDDAGAVHGTVTVVVFGPADPPDASRDVSAACKTDILAYINGTSLVPRRPIGAVVTVEGPSAAGSISPEVQVYGRPGFGRDWTPTGITVASVTPAARKVTVSADPTAYIIPGMKVVLMTHTGTLTEERIVQSTGANFLILTEWTTYDADVGSTVLPGGPLWQPTYDAILAAFEEVGPADSNDATRQRYPDSTFERPSTLALGNLYARVEAISGLDHCTFVTPAADSAHVVAPAASPTIALCQPLVTITLEN